MNNEEINERGEKVLQDALRGTGVYLRELTPEILAAAKCHPYVLPVVRDFNERVRSIANILVQMTFGERLAPVDEPLRREINRLGQALSYLVNSASFEDGHYHDFDRKEVDRKIGRE